MRVAASRRESPRGARAALVGRGERIRTSDPHNPIVVRYQAALRPDRCIRELTGNAGSHDTCRPLHKKAKSAPQNPQNLFKFHS